MAGFKNNPNLGDLQELSGTSYRFTGQTWDKVVVEKATKADFDAEKQSTASSIAVIESNILNMHNTISTDSERLAAVAALTSSYDAADKTLKNILTSAIGTKANADFSNVGSLPASVATQLKGEKGSNGTNGSNGANGTNGKDGANGSANALPYTGGTMSGSINMGGHSITNGGTFHGTATSANWADLAEKYEADAEYAPGTVLAIGGDKEVTEFKAGMKLAGVVSTQPGLLLNDTEETKDWPFVALKGRVPVAIEGSANKGDFIVAGDNGKGMAADSLDTCTHNLIGIALESGMDSIEVKV